jgi:hypothetical protein
VKASEEVERWFRFESLALTGLGPSGEAAVEGKMEVKHLNAPF